MTDGVAGLIGRFVGALLITFILSWLIGKWLKKRMSKNNAVITAAIITAAFTLIIASIVMGFAVAAITYLPCILVWLIIGLVKKT